MIYTALAVVLAFATALLCRRSPRKLTKIGVCAVSFAIVSAVIAVLSGNLGLYYLGGVAWVFGLFVLLARAVDFACRRRTV